MVQEQMYSWYFQHSGRAVQYVQCPYLCVCMLFLKLMEDVKLLWEYVEYFLMMICEKTARDVTFCFPFLGEVNVKTVCSSTG